MFFKNLKRRKNNRETEELNIENKQDAKEIQKEKICEITDTVIICKEKEEIADKAYFKCESVERVIIKDGVKSVGKYSFFSCPKLKRVTIPESLTSIGENAFGCSKMLTNITYLGTMAGWKAVSKGINWDFDTGKYIVICSDGVIDS